MTCASNGVILLLSTNDKGELKLYTNIRITKQTHEKLKAIKKVTGQTLDRVILDALKEKHKGLK